MKEMTRRNFIKTSAVGACGAAAMAMMPGMMRASAEEAGAANSAAGKKKNIVVLVGGSPAGNTVKLADAFAQGATEAGHTVTSFFLGSMQIGCCLGCDGCRYGKGCVQKDDMGQIYDAVKTADMVVFASAMRYWTITGVVKNVIERLYATCSEDKNPPKGRYEKYPDMDCALLMTAADDNWWTFDQAEKYYDYVVVNYLGWHDRGKVLAGACGGCGSPKCVETTGWLEKAAEFGKNL